MSDRRRSAVGDNAREALRALEMGPDRSHQREQKGTEMSTERKSDFTRLAGDPAARQIAAGIGKQAAAGASVRIRHIGARRPISRSVARSTATEAHPYSSFEQGGVRRFERALLARGPFAARPDLPPFRVS